MRSWAYGAVRKILNLIGFFVVWAGVAAAEPVTLVAFGDSLTQGYGLVAEDGFVPQMQTWLAAHGEDVDLRNAGVSGDTTAGGLARIDWTLDETVDGIIVALGANDMLRGIDPATSRANLDGILRTARERDLAVLLVGVDTPANFGAAYKTAFDAIYPELAAEYATLYFPNFLAGIADLPDRDAAVETYLQGDRIHPNAAGVALVVEAMGPSVLALARAAR